MISNHSRLKLNMSSLKVFQPNSTAPALSEDHTRSEEHEDCSVITQQQGLIMRRELGLPSAVSLVVGIMIGSGIFISPAGVTEVAGSVGLSLTLWLVAGLIALMGAMCYSELGTLIPKSGGEYSYIREAYGDMAAFLYTWVSFLLLRPSALAVKALTFAKYFTALFPFCGTPAFFQRISALTCLMTVLLLNCYSTRVSSRITVLATSCNVLGLLFIVAGGIFNMALGNTSMLSSGFQGSTTDASIISLALYDALWAYGGWYSLNFVTEEVKNPNRSLPVANLASVTLVIAVYVLTNLAYFSALTPAEIIAADAVAVLWGHRVFKRASTIIPVVVMISNFGCCNAAAFAYGRPVFAAARDGNLPAIFSYIHVTKLTPLPCMFVMICLSMVFVFLGDISKLIDFFSFTAWLFHGLTFLAVIIFRFTKHGQTRTFKVPIVIPILMMLVALYLVIMPIVHNPAIEFIYALLFIIGGAIFYFPFVFFRLRLSFIDRLVTYTQLLMEVVPTSKYLD